MHIAGFQNAVFDVYRFAGKQFRDFAVTRQAQRVRAVVFGAKPDQGAVDVDVFVVAAVDRDAGVCR